MSLLEIEGVTLKFGGVTAVNNLTMSVNEGEVFALVGPNGAGKSTVFNLISRFYTPVSGSIKFDGVDLLKLAPHEVPSLGIARTFQNIELFENATVLQNLLVGRSSKIKTGWISEWFYTKRVRNEERNHRRKVEEILDLLDMQQYRYEKVADLAYGARKNVELARALCAEPEILLLDEPASGLNPEETTDMSFWLKDIKEELGVTVVMVEHDMNLVGRIADRSMALANGEVIAVGTVSEVQGNAEVQAAYLGGAV